VHCVLKHKYLVATDPLKHCFFCRLFARVHTYLLIYLLTYLLTPCSRVLLEKLADRSFETLLLLSSVCKGAYLLIYLLTYLLTPCSRILLEKLTGS